MGVKKAIASIDLEKEKGDAVGSATHINLSSTVTDKTYLNPNNFLADSTTQPGVCPYP